MVHFFRFCFNVITFISGWFTVTFTCGPSPSDTIALYPRSVQLCIYYVIVFFNYKFIYKMGSQNKCVVAARYGDTKILPDYSSKYSAYCAIFNCSNFQILFQSYCFYLRMVCCPIYLCSFSFRDDGVIPQKRPTVPVSRWPPSTEVKGPSVFSIELQSRHRTTTLEREVNKDDGSSVEVRVMLDWTTGH